MFSLFFAGRNRKVGESTRLFTLLKVVGNGHFAVGLDSFFPEAVVKLHRRGRDGCNWIVGPLLLTGLSKGECDRHYPEG